MLIPPVARMGSLRGPGLCCKYKGQLQSESVSAHIRPTTQYSPGRISVTHKPGEVIKGSHVAPARTKAI